VEAVGRELPPVPEIALEPERLNRLLGTAFDRGAIAALLARVEVGVDDPGTGALRCRVPSHRNDLRRPVDLVEEVARIHGYDHLPTTLPTQELRPVVVSRGRRLVERVRDALAALGFTECMTLPLASAADADRIGLGTGDARRRAVRVLNPLTDEESLLRTTLVPSLLASCGSTTRTRSRRCARSRSAPSSRRATRRSCRTRRARWPAC
jgi:phenylalanyl-tRNA synthetase beta chain